MNKNHNLSQNVHILQVSKGKKNVIELGFLDKFTPKQYTVLSFGQI